MSQVNTKPWKTSVRVYDAKAGAMVSVLLNVEINWDEIALMLAKRAMKSKRKRAALLHGSLKAGIILT